MRGEEVVWPFLQAFTKDVGNGKTLGTALQSAQDYAIENLDKLGFRREYEAEAKSYVVVGNTDKMAVFK